MKILFLDIDGVVNSVRSAVALGGYPWTCEPQDIKLFDHVALALIKRVCEETDTKICLSSMWRHNYNSREDLAQFGSDIGLPFIISKTPTMLTATRGEEISAWLRDNEGKITKYAIVDDDSDMLKEQIPFFVKTNSKEGLSYSNYLHLLELLK